MGKINGNNVVLGDYYIGLDVGTNSVGWAAADKDYNLCKFKGNSMWGSRLFEEASDAATRRINRENRRRLNRRKQRLLILELLFSKEIEKIDPLFITRLGESALWLEDKSIRSKYSLFNDPDYTDKDYYKKYPTIYHLRHELVTSTEPHDIRLVYLAIHHIMKSRGHFLYELAGNDEILTVLDAIESLSQYIEEVYGDKFEIVNIQKFISVLCNSNLGVNAKKTELRKIGVCNTSENINFVAIVDALAGSTVKLCEMFYDDELKNAEPKNICLKGNLDEQFDNLSSVLGDRIDLLLELKKTYDAARLSQILSGNKYICDSKIELYEKNKKDLKAIKAYVRANVPDKYKEIFCEKRKAQKDEEGKKTVLNNYVAYSRYTVESGDYTCSQDDFCKYLKSVLPEPKENDLLMQRIWKEIVEGNFLTKLKGTDNGLIPYQLHRQELIKILDNASYYLPFLNDVSEGMTIKEKILATFEFKIPYYVGPLNSKSPNSWVIRFLNKENEKIYPWNFNSVVDVENTATKFIENLVGRCPYTGEKVLPKDSLLYSEFMLLNEINSIKINGKGIPAKVKQQLVEDLFRTSNKKVTKKVLKEYLISNGYIEIQDELSGIDSIVKSKLTSLHDFQDILDRTGDFGMVENIIKAVLIFGDDKKMLRRWLKRDENTHDLSENDINHICRLKYKDWGRLSEKLLTELKSTVNGKNISIIEALQSTNMNLMQLLSSEYTFAAQAEENRNELFGNNQKLTDKLDSLYISPAVRRSICQTLRIVDEVVDIKKSAPSKIFIEMARDNSKELKGKRTESRKNKLIELYKNCKEESNVLFDKLQNEDENRLRSDKLYLYYSQLGKCMYSGEEIDLESLLCGEKYDIDHIFPRSKVKDNSIDNRVIVKNELNREKTNIYPIKDEIRSKMASYWEMLKSKNLISEKKYLRLVRSYPLTEKELSDFVARQLTETQQSTKALAKILQEEYTKTRIIYSKAGNVADFRSEFDIIKCREVNNLHHAKDAYLNIVVGNVYCTKFTDRFFANIHSENYSLNRIFDFDVPGAWNKSNSIAIVKKNVFKNNAIVTRMQSEAKGQLFDLNIMPAGKGQLEKKEGLSIEKYGGYNNLVGAYFFAVEYTEKEKRVRTIQPVLLNKKQVYEINPIRYCESVLKLKEPQILVKKINVDSLLEIDGIRMYVSGRTGNRIICEHAYQLIVDYKQEKYIKHLAKYVDRCNAQKKDLPITKFDDISEAENLKLYDCFVNKSGSAIFAKIHRNLLIDLKENRNKFIEMPVTTQCKILLEILKAYQSNALTPNLKDLNGKKSNAVILISSKLNNFERVVLINQSTTGLFEHKLYLYGGI